MHKLWSLTQIFMKTIIGSSMSIKIGGKERTWAGLLLWAVIIASLLPILWLVYNMMVMVFSGFYILGEMPVAVGLVLNIGSILVFFFSLIAAPALFYFAKDVEYVLPLPLKAGQVIGAKFLVALAFEYIISLAVIGTMFVALRDFLPAGVLTFNSIVTVLTLPILPLVYSTILVMILMRVTRLGRNPDRYTLFVGILALVVAVGFSMYAGQALTIDPDVFTELLMGEPVFITTLNTVFISNGFAARAFGSTVIFGGALHNQVINLAITAAAVAVFFLLAKALYFQGVIGLAESGAPTKKMTLEDISKNTKGQSKFISYLVKELRLLFRSPTAFINCILAAFIMPILVAISIVPLMRSGELDELLYLIDFSNPTAAAMALTIMCALGFLIGGMVSITSTAISREGRSLFIMKYMPVSYSTQLNAKAVSGLVVLIPALIFMLIPMQVLFQAPTWLFIGGVLLTLPGVVFVNYMGLYIDLLRPKLVWDTEQAAIKQNMNALLMLAASFGITACVVALGLFVLRIPLVTFFGLLGVTGLLAYGAYYLAIGKGSSLLERLH